METGLISKVEGPDDDLYPDLDPLDDADFIVILGKLTEALERATERQEALSIREFLDSLDVDWAALSIAALDRLLAGAAAVIEGTAEKVIPRTSRIFSAAARSIIPSTKLRLIERDRLKIDSSLSTADKETGRALLRQQALYIRDEYGRRSDSAAARARAIVAHGVEQGLGQQDVAARLAEDVTLRQLARSRAYWDVIATAFANKARTATQLNAYDEAGITVYRFVAVLDERTTDICRMMDGKTFKVSSALALQRRAEALDHAQDIKDVQPWVKVGRSAGRAHLFYEKKGRRHHVADINESAVGQQDVRGIFSNMLSDEQLEAAGIMVPPLHARCRSTIVTE